MMKPLNLYIQEKLIINKDYRSDIIVSKSFNELRKIIEDRYDKLGPGSEQSPIDFDDVDVSEMTTFYNTSTRQGIFDSTKFKYIDISEWDVSKVKDMSYMFYQCVNLKSIGDLSNWNILNVEKTYAMFCNCYKLKSIGDLSNWDVSNVRYMISMFDGCEKLESVGDLSKWDISNVKSMNNMFKSSGITNIPSWYQE